MASYNELNALIDAYINRNGVQAITGQILNGVLKAMVEQLGRGYTIMGAAIPTTDPGTPDGPECYFASTPGTYTDFDGLQVAPGELALLCYTPSDGWTKATIYEGFREVGATIDGNVGTPSVGVSYADGVLSFDFHNMKGNPGQNGQDGAAAGFGTISADIAGGVGTPAVSVESSGPATAKNLQFHFTNLKGETGVTSVVATVDNTTGTPACTVSLVGQQLTLAFSGLKGAQGNTGSSVDYPFTIVNNLTTDDATQALSAAMGVQLESEVSQLEAEVDGSPANYSPGRIAPSGNVIVDEYSDGWFVCNDFIPVQSGDSLSWLSGENSTNGRYCLRLYGEDKQPFSDGYWNCNTQPKNISVSGSYANAKYVKFCFRKKLIDGETDNTTPLLINGIVAFIVTEASPGLKDRVEELEQNVSDLQDAVEDVDGKIDTAKEEVKTEIYDGQEANYLNGRIAPTGAVINDEYSEGWFYPKDFIPCQQNDVLSWTSGENDGAGRHELCLYDEDKNFITDAYWSPSSQPKSITITSAYSSAKYVRFSFKLKKTDNTDNTTPLLINGEVAFTVRNYIPGLTPTDEKATEALDKVNQLLPTDTEHGIIGENYPSEVLVVENQLQAKLANRFHFIHISDNHGAKKLFGYAQQYLDYSPAKFLINTGDLVADKFADKDLESFQTITLATEPTKPVYLALGNHDYSHATSRQAVFDAFIAPTNTHNGTAFDKTYYSLDFSTEKVKCIVLDMNDGWADADLPNYGPSGNLTWGKMSQTQINWLATQLQDAITNSLDVVIFIHTPPAQVSRFNRIKDFSDTINLDYARNLTFLPGLIDAFINGETASFTYDGNNYSFTFASGGHFVSWVCGHEHGDICGWMDGHENQFVAVVCRPYRDTSKYSGSYDGDKLGVHWNYCTIDAERKSFAVYRMGQQTTIFGTDRVSFRILYK